MLLCRSAQSQGVAHRRPRRVDRNLVVIGAGAAGLVASYVAAALKARVIDEGLAIGLSDNCQAWQLEQSGAYRLLRPARQKPASAQQTLASRLGHPTLPVEPQKADQQ